MGQSHQINESNHKIPKVMLVAVVLICGLPFILNMFGVDFGSANMLQAPPRRPPI